MPARDETPGAKRRVRTGCLTCRKRRRKCDEHRPSCENCLKRGAQCRYPGFTYVSITDAARSGYPSGNSSLSHATNDDLDARPDVHAKHPSETGGVSVDALTNDLASPTQRWQQVHSGPNIIETTDQSPINLQPSQTTPVERYHRDVHLPTESTTLSTRRFGNENTVSTTSSPSLNIHHAAHRVSSVASLSQIDPEQSSNSNNASPSEALQTTRPTSVASSTSSIRGRETALLCHFRYNLAPWLDINDRSAFFGVRLFVLARQTRAVTAAILSIAARHQYLKTKSEAGSSDLESCLRYRQEAESSVFLETGSIQQLVRMLLSLESFVRSSPRQWRNVVHEVVGSSNSVAFDVAEEPLQWACFRIDLGAAIMAGLPPLTPYHIWDAWRRASPPLRNPATVNMASFSILACSLSLTYHHTTEPASGSQSMSLDDSPRFGWAELWADCQTWYRRRPEELCPVLKCQAMEAAQIDPSSPASFPIELYSSPIALLSNVAYHLASLLLLSCKPRLVKPSADSKRALSESWHMQSIAGIATRNDFREQWDPVLIAGLIHIGPRMTHESQQDALLSCLTRANAATGLMLDYEMQALRSAWVS